MKGRILIILIGFFCCFVQPCGVAFSATNATIFTFRRAESEKDLRYEYDNELLRLALESTIETDGPYQLVPSPIMNYARARAYISDNSLPNFIIKLSYEPRFESQGMAYAPFPVDLGIVGYRVCFANPEVAEQFSQAKTYNDLRNFNYGQGTGWADVEILRHNGFTVTEVSEYESLFRMVANRRFDLFCRGANELLDEMNMHQHIQNLSYDKSIALFYPLPRFFYTNATNTSALDRIHRGLINAYDNGSLQRLWRKHYQKGIDFVELDQRRIFILENPLIKDLKFDYQKYFYRLSTK